MSIHERFLLLNKPLSSNKNASNYNTHKNTKNNNYKQKYQKYK